VVAILHSRRGIVVALGAAAVVTAAPPVAVADASPEDERFMRMALDEARQGDYAFGAVIIRDGQILARGRNLGRTNDDPTAHGEMVAIPPLPCRPWQCGAQGALRSIRPASRA